MHFLNIHIKKLALSWLLLNVFVFFYIFHIKPPTFDGDILNLISEKSNSPESNQNLPLYLSRELLSTHSKEIKFGIESKNTGEFSIFKKELKELFPELKEVKYMEKDEIEHLISNLWVYSFKGEMLKLLESGNTNQLTSRIKTLLSGPEAYLHATLLKVDPLLVITPQIKPLIEEFSKRNKIATFKLKEEENEKIFLKKMEEFISSFERAHPESKMHWSSYLRFKESSATKIEGDIRFVSTTSSILIPLSLVIFFGSLGAPLLSFISSLSGILLGMLFVLISKDSIHLITLAFGSSLVGASVDYAIHYQAESLTNPKKDQIELRNMAVPSLLIGGFTSILSFVGLYLTSFPGLKELAMFSIGSLIASLISTILWFPYISFVKLKTNLLTRTKKKNYRSIFSFLLATPLILGGLFFDSSKELFQDDIGALQSPDKSLLKEEIWFKDMGVSKEYSSFIFLTKNSSSEVLTQDLIKAGKLLNIQPFSIIPNKEEAELSYRTYSNFLEKNKENLRSALSNLGYDDSLLKSIFQEIRPDYIESVEQIASKFKIKDKYGFLPSGKTEKEIESILNDSNIKAEYNNHRESISKSFKNFRLESTALVSLSYVLILALLIFKYGFKNGGLSLTPSLLSIFSTLLLLNLLSIPLSFFGILAFVIVLGLSIDYSVFHLEDTEHQDGANLSIFLATLTTIITFGALSISETESLRNFGIVISLGVFFTAIYTYILFNKSE